MKQLHHPNKPLRTVLAISLFLLAVLLAMAPATLQAQPFAYVPSGGGSTVSVIDVATNTVTATVTAGFRHRGVAITPDGDFAYVANQFGTVSVISTATNTVTATVSVAPEPRGVAVTPDGRFVYVTHAEIFVTPGIVSVIDVANNTVTATVAVDEQPTAIAFTPDGSFAYVTHGRPSTVSVINTATNTVTATIPVGDFLVDFPIGVAITPDGSFAYVTNYGFFASGSTVWVISTATNTVVATVPVGTAPLGVAITPDGKFAYVVNQISNNVSVISTATNTVVATVATGGFSPAHVAITPDGGFAYVTNVSSSTVSVVSTSSNAVVATVNLGFGFGPSSIAITPAVISPEDAIAALISDVDALLAAGSLSSGQAMGLTNKLNSALKKLEQGNIAAALNKIQEFIDQVNSFINDGVLTAAEGQPLIDAANAIIAQINSLPKRAVAADDAELSSELPSDYALEQNYPNPFNPSTVIRFQLPVSSQVELAIYNTTGQLVRTLVSGQMAAGRHSLVWDATDDSGARVASGIYLYKLRADSFSQIRKMSLLR